MAEAGERFSGENKEMEATGRPLPAEDFYRHVNHKWLQEAEIPPSESRWGAFDILRHKTQERLWEIAENCQEYENAEKGSNVQLVGDFYRSGMDMETRNRLGMEPVEDFRSMIDGVENGKDAARVSAQLSRAGISPFFHASVEEDDKKAGSNAFYIEQGGLGLPSRDYYLEEDESTQDIQEKYKAYISKLFQMSGRGAEEADAAAESVFGLEHGLAEASLPEAEAREVDKNYFKYTAEEAKTAFPGMDWDEYLSGLGKPDMKDFVVMQPGFMEKIGNVLEHADPKDVKDYLEFTLLNSTAGLLDEDFVNESFAFNGQVLQGTKEQQPLWKKTMLGLHGTELTNAIGPLYCEQHFDSRDKENVMEMVADISEAFRDRVQDLDWMAPETKALTEQKLDQISFKMGFPDEWRDVSDLDIQPDAYAQNRFALAESRFQRKLSQLDEPYDRSEWHMPPTLVNACADLKREMTFPAAILQYPFYDSSRDEAYNYGAIGMVVGHELTHFFDDQGCKFDIDGNMNDWWSDEDKENFEAKTEQFVEYFGELYANGLRVDGQLTLGENIADVAGVAIAYDALQRRIDRDGGEAAQADGMTPEQRFFTGYSQIWAQKMTPEMAKVLILKDPHAPSEVRVNGVLAVSPEFHEAFGVEPDDDMYTSPEDQPKLW